MKRVETLIFDQADRSPDAVAVEHNGASLTYRDLKDQALEISRGLRNSGLRPGGTVGIFQYRSLATVPLLLGIWDAGGVIVPINPKTPLKMLEWVTQDSAPQIIVTEAALKPLIIEAASKLNGNSVPAILGGSNGSNGHHSGTPIPSLEEINIDDFIELPTQCDDCYVIYTSGSEGRPKGVKGSHKDLIHYLKWQAKEFSVSETDRFSQTAPLSFDFSFKELFVPLICGARVHIADRATVIDPKKFLAWVQDRGITIMCCVPTLLRSLLRLPNDGLTLESMRAVLISGDMLRWDDVIGWRERFGDSMSLFNLYGPTESTVVKLFYPIPKTKYPDSVNVPVGKPIPGADVLVLGDNGEPSGPGEIGEIVILSKWLARGYLHGEQMSHRPFCRISYQEKQRRAYRTGDLGRWLADGNLELIGRKDRQVKIRGYRIELNEIESILSEHPGIRDVAAVVPANDVDADNPEGIICYFTAGEPDVTEKKVRVFAQERLLPEVLSLIQFSRLDQLPLTVNGKVDRLKLESLFEATAKREVDRSPSFTVQQRIRTMWEELLALDAIDLQANFFELGGDSMTAIRLLRRLREELHAEVKLGDVYEFPNIAQLSDRVEQLVTKSIYPQP
jgi:amino acid adenylation domain-containing protein